MTQVETRCTQCGTTNNTNAPSTTFKHGGGQKNGTEVVMCRSCSGTCNLDECSEGSPCERCHTETVQNRCGKSVPTAQ